MKPEEAKHAYDTMLDYFCSSCGNTFEGSNCENKWCYKECVVPIRKALEKQIPKKIEKTSHGYECPSCKAFWATFKGNFIDTNYCPNCGQRIDWSDEE